MAEGSRETPSVLRRGESVTTKLLRIAEKDRREPRFRFTSLFHLMKEELLQNRRASLLREELRRSLFTDGVASGIQVA